MMGKYEKYQEALDKMCNRCFGDEPKKILQELVDQTKNPTLEEIKKEWEELGYDWFFSKEKKSVLFIRSLREHIAFILEIEEKHYYKTCSWDYSIFLPITFQEHQLLTKTFKALGWE